MFTVNVNSIFIGSQISELLQGKVLFDKKGKGCGVKETADQKER